MNAALQGCCLDSSGVKDLCDQVVQNISKVISEGEKLHYKKDQVLFYEGHLPYGFFLLQKGEVVPPAPADYVIGLPHLLSGTPYCATCSAKTDVEVLFISKAEAFKLLAAKELS